MRKVRGLQRWPRFGSLSGNKSQAVPKGTRPCWKGPFGGSFHAGPPSTYMCQILCPTETEHGSDMGREMCAQLSSCPLRLWQYWGTEAAVDRRVLTGCPWAKPELWRGSSARATLC